MAAGDGLVTMTPTSVDKAGTSATINADGSVDFTAVSSLSLNGVFTLSYDNYLVVIRHVLTSSTASFSCRLRVSGTDTSTNYVSQYVDASSTSITGSRNTSAGSFRLAAYTDQRDGASMHIYGPALAQATAFRSVGVYGFGNAYIFDTAATHSSATSYDGLTFFTSAQSVTGSVVVFGYEE